MEINWEAVAALGQVAGAVATFAAVVVSLHLARRSGRPILRVSAREHMILSGENTDHVITFSVQNLGDRPAEVRSLGWRTGWLKWGPDWLRFKYAIQMFDARHMVLRPPYPIAPGSEVSSYIGRDNMFEHAKRFGETGPIFTRKFPWGVMTAKTVVLAYTADGYTFRGEVDRSMLEKIAAAEREGRLLDSTESD